MLKFFREPQNQTWFKLLLKTYFILRDNLFISKYGIVEIIGHFRREAIPMYKVTQKLHFIHLFSLRAFSCLSRLPNNAID
jgi:hypothetical protein